MSFSSVGLSNSLISRDSGSRAFESSSQILKLPNQQNSFIDSSTPTKGGSIAKMVGDGMRYGLAKTLCGCVSIGKGVVGLAILGIACPSSLVGILGGLFIGTAAGAAVGAIAIGASEAYDLGKKGFKSYGPFGAVGGAIIGGLGGLIGGAIGGAYVGAHLGTQAGLTPLATGDFLFSHCDRQLSKLSDYLQKSIRSDKESDVEIPKEPKPLSDMIREIFEDVDYM